MPLSRSSSAPPSVPATTRPGLPSRPRGPIVVRHFAGPARYVGALERLRVAHVTDIHVGRVTPMAIQEAAVEMVNREQPDVVLMTGDYVCHSQDYLDALTDLVRRYRAPVLAVLGNHDHWAGADEVRAALRRGGVEVLDNVHTQITLRHQPIQIVGVDDAYTSHASISRAVRGLRPDVPSIGLSHIAEEADALWAAGVPFVLAGHTHAGQITFARLHELAFGRLSGHRYVHGMYGNRRNGNGSRDGAVYVGAGIGASVMPLRLGDRGRREVTIFELGAEPASFEEHHDDQKPLEGRKPSERKVLKRHFAVHLKKAKRERSAR